MMYGFFSATLPELTFDRKAEITLEEFDNMAAEELSKADFTALTSWGKTDAAKPELYRQMEIFDRFLTWRIANFRAEKLGFLIDNSEIPDEFFGEIDFAMPAAAASRDPGEREKTIDLVRWQKIDELEMGHDLDFIHLCCYRLRLAALEKYTRRENENGEAVFNASVDRISEAGENKTI